MVLQYKLRFSNEYSLYNKIVDVVRYICQQSPSTAWLKQHTAQNKYTIKMVKKQPTIPDIETLGRPYGVDHSFYQKDDEHIKVVHGLEGCSDALEQLSFENHKRFI